MIVYWSMFFLAACGVLLPGSLPQRQRGWLWLFTGILFAFAIGLRHEVGADWFNYLPNFDIDAQSSQDQILSHGDPAYHYLDWLTAQLGGDIYVVNLICASLLMIGTIYFCRDQPNPWLALLAAVPYMLIVVGMGYTRQAAALGLALMGLCALGRGRVVIFIGWIVIGTLFHKSAILLVPIAGLAASRNRVLIACLVVLVAALMYYLLIEEVMETFQASYIDRDIGSEGGAIRVAMNAIPSALFVMFSRRLAPQDQERKLWLWLALFSFVCIPLVGFASTAVDRVALYLIPIQLFVFSRLPRLAANATGRTALVVGIVSYYAAVEFVWLNFAKHAQYWVPYQFMPLS